MAEDPETVQLGDASTVSSGHGSLADPACRRIVSSSEPDEQAGPSSSSVYHSARLEGMARSRTEFATALEYEIEASKDHWSELQPRSGDEPLGEERERVPLTSFDIVQSLWRQYPQSGNFFKHDHSDLFKLGKKIAEGGQAEIFEAQLDNLPGKFVMKIFKEGSAVKDLQKQWPLRMLNRSDGDCMYPTDFFGCSPVIGGLVFRNCRFAFWMLRFTGDLRKLLDLKMERNKCQCAPLSDGELVRNMKDIAMGMEGLHRDDIVHRDLKASNILIRGDFEGIQLKDLEWNSLYRCLVADFECSVGVVGSGFWRAPEILQGVKTRKISLELFTKEADVYSYAMTCYEMITGRLPFENVRRNNYDVVLRGDRPELPEETKPWIKALLERCWHANPRNRPSFVEILKCIEDCGGLNRKIQVFGDKLS